MKTRSGHQSNHQPHKQSSYHALQTKQNPAPVATQYKKTFQHASLKLTKTTKFLTSKSENPVSDLEVRKSLTIAQITLTVEV